MVWDLSFTCDICGQKKGAANHWWMVALNDSPCSEESQPSQRFTLLPWVAEECCHSERRHLCGQNCAMQALERFMNTGSLQPENSLSALS